MLDRVVYYYMKNHRKGCKLQGRDVSAMDEISSLFLYTMEEIRKK